MGVPARLATQPHRATRALPHLLFKIVDSRLCCCRGAVYLLDGLRQVERVE